ncbi:prevent-host-death protein [Cytophagales bacterium WSM2-2]|nr:prevent-host-death protein [Cytophagales bacterium WSM2-2]
MKLSFKTLALLLIGALGANAQTLTQTVRGTVTDKISKTPLPGATVIVQNSDPMIGVTTDADGNFKLSSVPVGNQTIKISFIGYKDAVLPNVVVNSGKETVLAVPMDEDIIMMQEVVVRPDFEKNKPLNDMATVSARTFSVEETRKFAAAVNDPLRMVTSFAGVIGAGDMNNAISIRGNSPYGLLWRMEGVDIPNPNHFANVGTSGGGISILSSQMLTNSDFITGAFPAEYGNALAGVFDVNLRKGNNEKREYTVQASLLGTDVAVEGPFSKNYRGSYLVNYRYSTLSILNNLGVSVGDGITNYQDLSYNFYFPSKKLGNFSLFGFGGLSDQRVSAKKDSLQWKNEFDRFNTLYHSNTGAAGLKHSITLTPKTYLQSSFMVSGNDNGDDEKKLDNTYIPRFDYMQKFVNTKMTISSVLNHKFNAQHSLRSGAYFNRYYFTLQQKGLNHETNIVEDHLNTSGSVATIQLFSQWNYRATEQLTFNAGVHYLQLLSNNTSSVEPRASVKYNFTEQQSVSLGYGLHSQMQPVGIYEAQVTQTDGSITKPNANIGLNKAHHFVVGYDRSISKYLRVKAETYYQHLYNIAVKNDVTSPISTLNSVEGYMTDPLVNKGIGRNYGTELTVEQFTHNNMYFLLSASLFKSEYKALDNIWRSTRFDAGHGMSFTAGKDFMWRKNRVFGLNIRTIWTGGFRSSPIDVAKSMQTQKTEYYENQLFSQQMPDYLRADLRVSLKRNRARTTTTLALDLMNATNHQNVWGSYFDPHTGVIKTAYQLGLLPVISYRIEF